MARLADPLGYGADSIGAEVGDITSELLADTLQLTHPDRHPPERKELARRVTAELLALKPYVFPAPKPDPAPTVESYASANPRRREIGDPSQKPAYPCELCADALPMDYCDACKAEWGKRQQLKREQEDAERLERNRRQRERYKQQRKHCQDLKRFNIEHHLEPESVCETCGMKLKGKRRDSKYCSNACRQRAYVKRGGMGSNARPLSREQIEQAIEQVFAADPDNAFTIYDLCQRVYPGLGEPEKKHRIAVIAAAKRLVERQGSSLDIWRGDTPGRRLVFYNFERLTSYAMARMKSGWLWCRSSDEEIRATLAPGGNHHECVVEGGAWWRHWQLYLAEAKGETETEHYRKLRQEQEQEWGTWGTPPSVPAA